MRRNPLYIFKDVDATGIYNVPLKSTVQIVDAGKGLPMFIQLIKKDNLSEYSTIQDLFDNPDHYIDIQASGSSISQLESVVENGLPGWRLLGRDPGNFGSIGEGAVDFSASEVYAGSGNGDGGATGANSFATGFETTSSGMSSFTTGLKTQAPGENSFAAGSDTKANAIAAATFGRGTVISNEAAMAIGQYNAFIDGAAEKTAFEVGIGTSTLDRLNGLEVYLNGNILAPQLTIDSTSSLKTLITKEYLDSLNTESELEYIDGINGHGWRLRKRNDIDFGDIGEQAVDFSYSTGPSTTRGATGTSSFATGENVIAGGDYSHAGGLGANAGGKYAYAYGKDTVASGEGARAEGIETTADGIASYAGGGNTWAAGDYSHTEGKDNRALKDYSHAEGYNTFAEGESSHTEGKETNASGTAAHAEGSRTDASGEDAHAEGSNTMAPNPSMHASGQWNVGKPTSIFEVGIGSGTAPTPRINAFEINQTNGRVFSPQVSEQDIKDEANGRILVTKDYVNNNSGVSELERVNLGTTPGCALGGPTGNTEAGWRILGRNNTPQYQTIGCGAMDFSFSNAGSGGLGASGLNSFAEGINTLSPGTASHAAGTGTVSGGDSQFVMGRYNLNDVDNVFEVGIGSGVSANPPARINAFQISNDGIILAPSMETSEITDPKCLVTREYVDAVAGSVSELELVTESGNTGWRLLNRNIANYGNIGAGAVDFSYSNGASTARGALEINSFAVGLNTTASGINSFVEGESTVASYENSHAAGHGTFTNNKQQFVVGEYNDAQINTLFEVGNGATGAGNKSNALEVYKTGIVRAPRAIMNATVDTVLATIQDLTTRGYVDTEVADEISKIPAPAISNLTDVDVTTTPPANGLVLKYNGGSSKWEPSTDLSGGASTAEQGGVLWDTAIDYLAGDIVSWAGIAYIALVDVPASITTPAAPDWAPVASSAEVGGRLYQSATTYVEGDIVTDDTDNYIYQCTAATSTGDQPNGGPLGEWKLYKEGVDEVGGIFYRANTQYTVGDIITASVDNGVDAIFTDVYRCKTDYLSAVGGAPTDFFSEGTKWIKVAPSGSFLDLYDTPTDYVGAGDHFVMVTNNGSGDGTGLEFADVAGIFPTGLIYGIHDPSNTNTNEGWMLADRSTIAHAYIGIGAINFGITTAGTGATGDNSVMFGNENHADGVNSVVFGNKNTVTDTGLNSAAFGINVDVTGSQSIAVGKNLSKSAIVPNIIDNSAIFGQYNDTTTQTIFEVGVGNEGISPLPDVFKNALEIYPEDATPGVYKMLAPSLDRASIDAGLGKSLVTKEYVDEVVVTRPKRVDFNVADKENPLNPNDMLVFVVGTYLDPVNSAVDVWLNGRKLRSDTYTGIVPNGDHDYGVTNGVAPDIGIVTLNSPAMNGDWLQVGYTAGS